MSDDVHNIHKKGRPTSQAQITLRRSLQDCFEEGLSATTASKVTGVNIKTVCKYYEEWTEKILEFETADFIERQKKDRAQIIATFDFQIIQAGDFVKTIKEEIKKYKDAKKDIPRHLLGINLDAMRYQSNLVQQKNAFLMQPIMDEALREKIAQMIKNHGIDR